METTEKKHWSEPDEHDTIDVPDHLMDLFNKVGMQIRFHTISGKGEVMTIAHIVRHAEKHAAKVNAEQVSYIKELISAVENNKVDYSLLEKGRKIVFNAEQ